MANNLFLAAAVLALGGCACKPTIKTEIQIVEVPISVPCSVAFPERPDFNFDKLTEDSDIFDKTKALLADMKLHLGYEIELEAALRACK